MYKPMRRVSPALGIDKVLHGMNNSAVQPVSVSWLRPRHGPSHSLLNWRSGSTVPSMRESPRLTPNQKP